MNKKNLITFIKWALTALVVYYVVQKFSQNWEEVVEFEWEIDYLMLGLSIFLHLLTLAAFSKVWSWLIFSYGFKVPFKYAFKIAYLTNLGRYVPGKIWSIAGMAYIAKKLEIDERSSVTSWMVALVYALASAFVIGAGLFLFSPDILQSVEGFPSRGILLLATIGAGLVGLSLLIYPKITPIVVNTALSLLGRERLNLEVSRKTSFIVFWGYAGCWILYGLSFWTFLRAIVAGNDVPVQVGVLSFILAYQIGYLAFFAPGGIGVRELFLAFTLSQYLGPAAAGVAIAARLWNLSVEIISALIAFSIKYPNRENSTANK